ncbi:hypothetical protein ACFSO7_18215 [Bacillus sp. CGMCC 1.16607]|uniref:hypothetical protein n=1 Tax=Bacillus sp. CGMCC 1.16607 TaxID=3351842 RepID=UPI00363B5777
MRKSEWSDNELEQLLREMPKIKDHRDPRDIYQSLSIKAKKRKRPVWFIPSIATAAAVLLLFLLVPNVWQNITNNNNKSEIALDKSNNKMKMQDEAVENKITADIVNPEGKPGFSAQAKLMTIPTETAIYSEDLVDQEVITYLVPDKNVTIFVPVSIIVPKENKPWLESFQSYSEKLTEAQWGLTDFYPLNATLSMVDEHTVNVDVPEGHIYGQGSANEWSFSSVQQQIFSQLNEVQKITFSTNTKPGIELGNNGVKNEVIREESKVRHSYYLFYPNNSNMPFLVPSVTPYTDLQTAFDSMRANLEEDAGLIPSLSFNFTIQSSSDKKLVLKIEDHFQLTDEPMNIYAIEAILLTAKEFGYESVKFENASAPQIGRFNLENEIKVPIAPNKVFLP